MTGPLTRDYLRTAAALIAVAQVLHRRGGLDTSYDRTVRKLEIELEAQGRQARWAWDLGLEQRPGRRRLLRVVHQLDQVEAIAADGELGESLLLHHWWGWQAWKPSGGSG